MLTREEILDRMGVWGRKDDDPELGLEPGVSITSDQDLIKYRDRLIVNKQNLLRQLSEREQDCFRIEKELQDTETKLSEFAKGIDLFDSLANPAPMWEKLRKLQETVTKLNQRLIFNKDEVQRIEHEISTITSNLEILQ